MQRCFMSSTLVINSVIRLTSDCNKLKIRESTIANKTCDRLTACAFNVMSGYIMHGPNVYYIYMLKKLPTYSFTEKYIRICATPTPLCPTNNLVSYMLPQYIIQWNPTYQSLTECSAHQAGLYIYKINKKTLASGNFHVTTTTYNLVGLSK